MAQRVAGTNNARSTITVFFIFDPPFYWCLGLCLFGNPGRNLYGGGLPLPLLFLEAVLGTFLADLSSGNVRESRDEKDKNMKESMQLSLLGAFYLVCLLVTVMYPMGKFESFLLWAIFMACVGVYAYRDSRNDLLWH